MYSPTNFAFGLLLLSLSGYVVSHGTVSGIMADGVFYQGYSPNMQFQKPPPQVVGWSVPDDLSNGFVGPENYSTPEIICHIGATPAPIAAKATAGSNVTVFWTKDWPSSHHGLMLDYLAACPGGPGGPGGGCAGVDKTQLRFFKIDAAGIVDGSQAPGVWASDQMIAANDSWTVTIPGSIAPGHYVLRHETVALHQAQQQGGAQNYPQCLNLDVQGGGTTTPDGTLGTELYKPDDPGLVFNIYTKVTDYPMPGPALFAG